MSRITHAEKASQYRLLVAADSPYDVKVADEVVSADCALGAVTARLPAPAAALGLVFVFTKTDGSGNAFVIDGNGSLIDGQATLSLSAQYDSITLFATAGGWISSAWRIQEVPLETVTVVDSPYAISPSAGVVEADASGGPIQGNLPEVAKAKGRSVTVVKTDNSSNMVTLVGHGGDTINGQPNFTLQGQYDTVTLYATPTGWVITNYLTGTSTVPNDAVEFQILNRTGVNDILVAANLAAAQGNAAAQADAFSTLNYTQVVFTIDLTVVGAATELYFAARTSGKAAPNKTVVADWSPWAIDNIDRTTGISTSPDYVVAIPVVGVRRYTRSYRVWGSWSSALVWCNGAGAKGIIYAQRFSG